MIYLYFIYSYIIVYLIYLIGNIIFITFQYNSKSENIYYTIFLKLIAGLSFCITVFSLYKTNGNSISIGYVLYFFLFIAWHKFNFKRIKLSIDLNKELVVLVVLFSLCFLFYSINAFFYFNSPINNLPYADEFIYSSYSAQIGLTSIESYSAVKFLPYHYYEFWFADCISFIFKTNHLISFSLIAKTALSCILTIGMIALSKNYKRSNYIVAFACLATTIGAMLLDYNPIIQNQSNIAHAKYQIIAIFLVLFFVLYNRNSKFRFVPLCIIPLLNISTAPTLITTLFCFFIYQKITNSNIKYSHILVPLGLTVFMLIGFYGINNVNSISNNPMPLKNFYSFNYLIYDYVRLLKNFTMYLPYFFIPFLFCFKSLGIIWYKLNRDFVVLIIIMIIVSPLMVFLGFPFAGSNSDQFYTSIVNPFLNIYLFILFLFFIQLEKRKILQAILLLFLFIILIYNTFIFINTKINTVVNFNKTRDVNYILNVSNKINKNNRHLNGFAFANWFCADYSDYTFLTPFSTKIDYINIYSIIIGSPIEKVKTTNVLSSNREDLYEAIQFANKKKYIEDKFGLKINDLSILKSNYQMKKFLNKCKIDFLIFPNSSYLNLIPSEFIDEVYKDKITNDVCVFIKN